MPEISDAALPWVILVGGLGGTAGGAAIAVLVNRWTAYRAAWRAGRLSGLPTLAAPVGCDDCSAEDGEPHRHAGCPGNVRQIDREQPRRATRYVDDGGAS